MLDRLDFEAEALKLVLEMLFVEAMPAVFELVIAINPLFCKSSASSGGALFCCAVAGFFQSADA